MNTNEKQYIGILASEREIQESFFQDVAFINGQNDMQYVVKGLSKEGLPQQFLSGYINSLDEDCDIEENYYLDMEERIENFRSEVEDKLFVFSYIRRDNRICNILDAQLLPIPESFNRNTKFFSVPVFCARDDKKTRGWEKKNAISLYRDYTSYEQFVDRIKKLQHVGRIIGYDKETNKVPPFVIWKEADGTLYGVTTITGWEDTTSREIILKGKELNRYELSHHEEVIAYNEWVNPTLLFLPENTYQEIIEKIGTQGNQRLSAEGKKSRILEEEICHQNEEQLLISMKYYSQDRKLLYKESDLINFHTAVKSSDLVVLSGMSGTGKSALVDVYARALGISSENKQLLFIPVSPSWNDDTDLLGYIDLIHNVYHASDTGFVNLLVEAQKEENKDKLYLICFDEMNLARVEHYFSKFLSILEKPKEERALILYDRQYSERLENAKDYPWKILIGENIKFIGTVNIDESTYHFSDKVLDRANVITLDIMDYSKVVEEESYEIQLDKEWTMSEYYGMVSSYQRNQELRSLLWEIHTLLQTVNIKLGIGPRIVTCIEQYLANLPKGETICLSMDEAIDYQMVQRVLTKVRGPENELGKFFGDEDGSGIQEIFDKYSHLSSFEKSRQLVEHKKKEIEIYGYCI